MHNVHPSFFILQLPDFSTFSKLKDEKARMHNVHPSFFILQLIEFSASWLFSYFRSLTPALKDEKARMHMVHPARKTLQPAGKNSGGGTQDHIVHLSFFILQLTDFNAEG